MSRKNPKARRATALILLASLALAVETGALLVPTPAQALTGSAGTPGRPVPGDPNTPDEGGRTGVTTLSSANTSTSSWIVVWLSEIAHLSFVAR